MRVPVILSACLVVSLCGCRDRKVANEDTLAEGLNHAMARLEPCPGYVVSSFPHIAQAISPPADLEALVNVGLLSKQTFLVNGTDQIRYELTDKGRDSTFTGEKNPDSNPQSAGQVKLFCFGRLQVNKVLSFTDPAEAEGMHVTRVTYTRKLTHQPGWASNATVLQAFPAYAPEGYAKNKLTAGMELTSNGWRLPDDTDR